MASNMGTTDAARHLRIVDPAEAPASPESVRDEVRSARREVARLLRALQASGQSVTAWPDDVVTRLAHVDAVTARFLIDPASSEEDVVRGAVAALRVVERWVVSGLRKSDLAAVRRFELMIQVSDEELEAPLLSPDGAPEEQSLRVGPTGGLRPRSLREGLRSLDEVSLGRVCRRLGVRPLDMESADVTRDRGKMESAIAATLRDDHLLAILVATLSPRTHGLLAALVRARLSPVELETLVREEAAASVSGGEAFTFSSPIEHLVACGLAYRSDTGASSGLWVPVELQRRLDGVLRSFGI